MQKDAIDVAQDNKRRYELFSDRRRVTYEVRRLVTAMIEHPRWPEVAEGAFELELYLSAALDSVDYGFCIRACEASSQSLQSDVRQLYVTLVRLARLWVALEDDAPVAVLLARHRDGEYLASI